MDDNPASHHHQENGIQDANQAHGPNPPPNTPPPPQGRRLRARGPRPSYCDSEEQAPPQAEDQSESSSVKGKGKRKRGGNEDGPEKEKPFGCDQKGCGTACGRLMDLNRHRTNKHGIKEKLTADDWREWKKNRNNDDNENAETAAPSNESSTPASTSTINKVKISEPQAIATMNVITKLLGGDTWRTQQWKGRLLISFHGLQFLRSVSKAVQAAITSSGEEIKDGKFPENLCGVLEDLREKSKEEKFWMKHFDEATEILNGRASALDGSSTPASIPAVQKKKSSVALGQSSTPSTSALDQPLDPQAIATMNVITKLLGGDTWKTQQHNDRALISFHGHVFLSAVRSAVRAAITSSGEEIKDGKFPENLCEVLEDSREKSGKDGFWMRHFVEATEILNGRDSHSYQRCQRCREKDLSCKDTKDGCKSCMAAGANCQYDVRPKQCPSLERPSLSMEHFKETSTAYVDRLKAVLESSRKEVEKKKEENETRKNGNASGSNLTSTVYHPGDMIPRSHSSYRRQGTEACNSCGFPCCPNGLSFATEKVWLHHHLIYHSYLKLPRCFCGFTGSKPSHFGGGKDPHKCQTELKGKELETARKESKLEREEVWEILNSIITDRVNCGLTSLPSNLLEDTKFWGVSRWSPSVATASTPASSISPSPNAASSSSISPTSNVTSSSTNASRTASAPSSSINQTASAYSSPSTNASPNVTSPSTNASPNTTTTTTTTSPSTEPTANASSSSTKPTANAPSTNPTANASSSSSSTNPSPKVASPPTKNPNPIHFAASNRVLTTARPIKRIIATPAMAGRLPDIMKTYELQTQELEKKKRATGRVEAPKVICQNCQRNPNREELSVRWEESNGSKGEPSSFRSVGTLERGQRTGKERSANGGRSTKGSRANKNGKGKEKARDPCDDCQSASDQSENEYMSKD